ncbi:uncharacterized protein (DUF697 family) [Rubricella aquisinus]|uniref:Uncharacterized protein (DUF697 family) n=1 Tax=Rubricella aquisinus TaxID=2028108 RepID=A0A840WQJ8_9RHOB|nr:DUF697 domain-containing protein [Rubricella aquisinus]MBB5516323.1 uncharacterized protein (DUF697 family) [Rubricella aquisinus]
MTEESQTNQDAAKAIVKTYMGWSAGAALIPMPYVDLAAITGIQVKMIADLSDQYDMPFRKSAAKTAVAALLATVIPAGFAGGAASLVKAIPGVGPILGIAAMPTFAAASTYAIGSVFTQHFESGGTLLDFDADAMREHFKAEFEAASSKSGGTRAKASS